MPREQSDTKAEIRSVALELFARQGFEKTSLREIAERLGVTKAALYYHYASKNDLLTALVTPLHEDMDALFARLGDGPVEPRLVFGAYFDVCVRHSGLLLAVLADLGALAQIGLVESVLEWRDRLDVLLVGRDAPLPARMGAVMAIGGLQDIAVVLDAEAAAAHREHAVRVALAALAAGASGMD
ncbi:TetR/AcrR family transcriptional regulator [Nocardiopsis aegyptia]|uniref:TetR/AcrR family transcriptional regulator n=1 Tax=Nocardiopsis aegyptia TaxID=220378 RepID=UPI00366D4B44